jgi:hypothetical protein
LTGRRSRQSRSGEDFWSERASAHRKLISIWMRSGFPVWFW